MCRLFGASSARTCQRMRPVGQKEEAQAHTGTPPAVTVIGAEGAGGHAADGPDTCLITISL